jgi:hypothetical protein
MLGARRQVWTPMASWGHAGAGQEQAGVQFLWNFLYPAPLSSLEFICGIRDTLIKLRAFSGEAGTGSQGNCAGKGLQ